MAEDQTPRRAYFIEPVEAKEQNKGGIYIPDTAKEKPMEGIVDRHRQEARQGRQGDRLRRQGRRHACCMPKYGGTEVKFDDKEYQLVREDDLLGVIG
jgi:chaperonin GroES